MHNQVPLGVAQKRASATISVQAQPRPQGGFPWLWKSSLGTRSRASDEKEPLNLKSGLINNYLPKLRWLVAKFCGDIIIHRH